MKLSHFSLMNCNWFLVHFLYILITISTNEFLQRKFRCSVSSVQCPTSRSWLTPYRHNDYDSCIADNDSLLMKQFEKRFDIFEWEEMRFVIDNLFFPLKYRCRDENSLTFEICFQIESLGIFVLIIYDNSFSCLDVSSLIKPIRGNLRVLMIVYWKCPKGSSLLTM